MNQGVTRECSTHAHTIRFADGPDEAQRIRIRTKGVDRLAPAVPSLTIRAALDSAMSA